MKRSESSMQVQRSWLFGLVVACLFSCVTAVILCTVTVVVNQSSIKIDALSSTLQGHAARINQLESQNVHLRLKLEKTQARLYKLEQTYIHIPDQPSNNSNKQSSPDLPNRMAAEDAESTKEDNAKGDGGVLEKKMHSQMGDAKQDQQDSYKVRWLRASRRGQRDEERPGKKQKECSRRCKGEKGEQGAEGPVSYGGQKGQRGEKGECEYHTPVTETTTEATTDATTTTTTTTTTTQDPGVPLWSDARPAALLAAHFEGGRLATINTGERRDPINRGYVDLSALEDGWVPYWRHAQWMDKETRDKFILDSRGNVTVTEGGIYYVYSQMLYYDPSVFMGHSLYIGGQKRFSCTECTVDRDRKFNTCYIGGVVQINSGDRVGIKVSYANRVINLHPDSTHFGMIRLS